MDEEQRNLDLQAEQDLVDAVVYAIRQAMLPKFTHISIDYDGGMHKWNYSMRGYEYSVAGGDYDTLAEAIEDMAKEFYDIEIDNA